MHFILRHSMRVLSMASILLVSSALSAQSRQYVCAPGLLFCDDFNTAGEDVDRTRWRAPSVAEARRGRTLFRNTEHTPALHKLRVENGTVRLVVSNHNPTNKSEPKKTEPTRKLEKETPADDKKTMDKMSMASIYSHQVCTGPDGEKTKPDTRMRPLEKKIMPANHPYLGTQLIARKAFAPPGAYPFWSAVSISMRARFPKTAAGPTFSLMLGNIFPPVGAAMPTRNEIDFLFTGSDLTMPLEKRMVGLGVVNNQGLLDGTRPMSVKTPLDFAAYHVYRMDWGPNYITWYIDGKRIKRERAVLQRSAPMHLKLSAFAADIKSAGGTPFEPTSDATAVKGFQMEVDWVRAQKIATSAVLNPAVNGRAVDHCFAKGKHCGRMAADYYCQMKGFDQAGHWTLAARKGGSLHLSTGKKCMGHACRGFATVTCFGGMAERDGPMFRRPMVRHANKSFRLDWCLSYGKQCGRPVAEAFCRMRGYASTRGFATERYVSPTHVLDETRRKICTGRICDGFKYIACGS